MTDAVERVLARYDSASPEQRERGRAWYPAAQRILRREARTHGTTLHRAAAVFAITSPDASLVTNLDWTRAALASRGTAKVGRYPGRMVPAVRAALTGRRPSEHVSGPKVSAFYRATLGDTGAVVLDRWALREAGYASDSPRNRAAAEQAYREAAALRGETPRDMQAIVWTVAREQHSRKASENRRAAIVRLRDIHDM
jgi:hypothetical protein